MAVVPKQTGGSGGCKNCGWTETFSDPYSGTTICANPECGEVLEENKVVNDVSFSEGKDGQVGIVGQKVPWSGARSFGPWGARASREITLQRGNMKIEWIGQRLHLNTHILDAGKRMFMLAVQRNFSKGRKTSHVAAACLYVVCRRDQTPHMLIDYSDALQATVRALGQVYMKLMRLLNLEHVLDLPVLDPSLFMERFANKLDLGEAQHQVSQTAVRIIQAMKRDWLVTGRRPTGLCGAALLLACRSHGFERDAAKVASVVRLGEVTLRRRLLEFQKTPAALLDREKLEVADFSGPSECLPPIVQQQRKRAAQPAIVDKDRASRKQAILAVMKRRMAKQKGASNALALMDGPAEEIEKVEKARNDAKIREAAHKALASIPAADPMWRAPLPVTDAMFEPTDEGVQQVAAMMREALQAGAADGFPCGSDGMPLPARNVLVEWENESSDSGEELSDDEEVDGLLLSEEEEAAKAAIWHDVHKEFLEDWSYREEAKRKQKEAEPPRKRRAAAAPPQPAATAFEATQIALQKVGAKQVNWTSLQSLFGPDSGAPEPAAAGVQAG